MGSSISFWQRSPWKPDTELSDESNWLPCTSQTPDSPRPASGRRKHADDQIRLLDHLGIECTHPLGGCIGGPFCLSVVAVAPDRVAGAVLQQPTGLEFNRHLFQSMFDKWAAGMQSEHSAMGRSDWEQYRSNMFDGGFVCSMDPEGVQHLP